MGRGVRESRSGYALVWVIVTVAIIAALVAATAPTLAVVNERSKAVRTALYLKGMALGFIQFESTIGNYPGRVSQLTNVLTTSDKNTCGSTMSSGDVSDWPTNAPYAPFYTPTSGLWTDLGRLRDSIPVRTFPTLKTPVFVEIPGVSAAEAAMLDRVVDGDTGDTVTFAAPVNDTTTVRYRLLSSNQVTNNRC